MKDKKVITITNTFQKVLDEPRERKPKRIWVDKGSEFCNRSVKSWLKNNDIEICSTHNEGKPDVTEMICRLKSTNIWLKLNVFLN